MNAKVLAFLCSFIISIDLAAQSRVGELNIGDKLPDLQFSGVYNYSSEVLRTSDMRGKFVIIDFWSRGCIACVRGFPNLVRLQRKFKDKIQVLLVTKDNDEQAYGFLKRLKTTVPDLPIITSDTVLSSLFPYLYVPHQVWIDADGRVKFISNGYNATESTIEKLISGANVVINNKKDFPRDTVKIRPLYNFEDAHQTVQFASFVSKYNPNLPRTGIYNKFDSMSSTVRNTYINYSILSLYAFAVNGQIDIYSNQFISEKRIILEVQDSTLFLKPRHVHEFDEWQRNNVYNYEQVIPENVAFKQYKYMLEDLNRFFGDVYNIEGRIENRRVKCYVLTKISSKYKLVSDGGREERRFLRLEDATTRQVFTNYPFRNVIGQLRLGPFKEMLSAYPFIDETGLIHERVDMDIRTNLRSFHDLRKEINKYGLDIIVDDRILPCLVIKDVSLENRTLRKVSKK